MNGFYWIYLAMFAFLLAYEYTKNKEDKRLVYYASCGFLILIFVLQDFSVSIDIAEYMRQWALIPDLTVREIFTHKFEFGYVLLCWVLERVFASDRMLLLVLSLLIMLPFCRSYERETEDPMIALMAFLALGMYMHAIIFWRQLVAMAIFTFGHRYIRERKFFPFLLTILAAMTFHKVAVILIAVYVVYNVPISKWIIAACAGCSAVLGFFGEEIVEFGIRTIYPRYVDFPRLAIGGETLLALLWVVTLLSWWMLSDRLDDPNIRLPFLMILMGATLQPVCFYFYNWLRIVLFFRIALVPMTAQLYTAMFRKTEDNKALDFLRQRMPKAYAIVRPMYDKKWFRAVTLLLLFAVLFVWYESELDGAVYIMAPIV